MLIWIWVPQLCSSRAGQGRLGCGSRSAPHHAPEWPQPYGHLGGPRTGRPPASQPGRRVPSQLSPDVHIAATSRVLFPLILSSRTSDDHFPLAAGHIFESRFWFWLASIFTVACVLLGAQAHNLEQARLERFATTWSIDPSPFGTRLGTIIKITCSVQFPGVASQVVARVTEVGTVINCKSARLRQSDNPPNNARTNTANHS